MAKKKVSRKELLKEPDEFLTFSRKLFLYIMDHKGQAAGAIGGLLLVLILLSGLKYFSIRSEDRSFVLLENVRDRYEAVVEEKDADAAYDEVQKDFEDLLEKYGDTQGGRLGRVIYANIAYGAGRTPEAIDNYEAALRDFENEPAIRNMILSGLGYAYERQEEYGRAAGFFERVTSGEKPVLKADALFHLGEIYARTGDEKKSREAFEKLLAEHEDSPYADMVREKIAG